MAMQRQGRGVAGRSHGRAPIPGGILARMRPRAQRAYPPPLHSGPAEHEYAFLIGLLIDRATLDRAEAEAVHCGVTTHAVLLAAGRVSQLDYAAALARWLGVALVSWNADLDFADAARWPATEIGLPARLAGRPCRVLAATDAAPAALSLQVAALRGQGIEAVLAPQLLIDAALEAQVRSERIDRAARGLLRQQPASSAGASAPSWQVIAGAGVTGLLIGGFAVQPDATLAALTALIALPFLCVTALRLVALRQVLASPASKVRTAGARAPRIPDGLLPVYTVLVPVFREANVLPGLVQSLRSLDYPAAKLEIFLVLEAVDTETQAAVLKLALPGNFRSLIVPEGGPQTKPKALNYALQFARGDYVVVYDAEDRPQPGQLRRAWDVFRRSPPGLACLQAQLNIYSSRSNIRYFLTPSCRRSRSCGCRFRWGARRTISRAPRCSRSAPGTRSM